MEWLLTAIIAPLAIAGVIASYRRRSIVFFVDAPMRAIDECRYFQSLTIWNAGGQAEEDLVIRIPERFGVSLVGSSEVVSSDDMAFIIRSLPAGDRCRILLASTDELADVKQISVRSKSVRAKYVSSGNDVITAFALGNILLLICVGLSVFVLSLKGVFEERDGASRPIPMAANAAEGSNRKDSSEIVSKEKVWIDWEVDDYFAKSDLAKYYVPPAFPIIAGDPSRNGKLVSVPFIINNATDSVLTISFSISTSESSSDPEPWKRSNRVSDLVVGPATQRQIRLEVFSPKSSEQAYVVLQGFISHKTNLYRVRRVVKVG